MRDRVALTYDMNVLQSLDAPVKFLVTLNRTADIDPAKVLKTITYHHPVYLPAGVAAQKRRAEISGVNRTVLLRRVLALRLPRRRRGQRRVGARGVRAHATAAQR